MSALTLQSLYDIAPEAILVGGGIVILLLEAFASGLRRSFSALAAVTVVVAGWAAWVLVPAGESFNGLIVADGVTLAFTLVVLAGALLGLLSSQTYLRREGIENGEYQALFLWCVAGLLFMLRATELLTIFLSLELLSLCLYALAGFHRRVVIGSEAALKYFLMGAFASAFVLMGLALTYGETGTTRLPEVLAAFAGAGAAEGAAGVSVLGGLGIVLLVAGFGFKMSLVPFHAWAPDTYQGAPSPFVGFLSVAPKAASALVLIRVLTAAYGSDGFAWSNLVALLAVASMVVGNLFALVQKDIKRMLAYSGIAHMGYLVIALTTLTPRSVVPVAVYLAAYTLMNGGAFAVITLLYDRPGEQHLIKDLSGAGYRHPLLGACLMICMLSLGGLPPTFGFIGKYLVFQHAVANGDVWLAVVGVLTSLVGVVYYLRVVYHLYMKPELTEPRPVTHGGWAMTAAVLGALGTLVLGLFPGELVDFLLAAVGGS
jgi:NADH-quinone oxidoreductase subunit N